MKLLAVITAGDSGVVNNSTSGGEDHPRWWAWERLLAAKLVLEYTKAKPDQE